MWVRKSRGFKNKSSYMWCFIIKTVLENFAMFTGKYLFLESLFKKVADLAFRPATLVKRDSNTGVLL